jgi:hypothetical protein
MGLKTVVYLEGGGSNEKKQRAPYRSEFAKLLEKAEITNVRVIACGSRNEAHNSFRNMWATSVLSFWSTAKIPSIPGICRWRILQFATQNGGRRIGSPTTMST